LRSFFPDFCVFNVIDQARGIASALHPNCRAV
jgi:hypothetical protein